MSGNVIRIEPLGKENYDTWKLQMEAVLVKNEMWGYVNGSIEKPNNEENTIWEENDKKARADLILAINPNELRQIKNCVTSNGIWKKLKELYESKGPARKATLLKQLIMSKMNEGETMKNHLNNFFNIIDKLEEMELKIVDDLVTILLLYSIPDSYENFRIAIESRDELPKPETLKIKLTEEYEARKSRENQNSPGALLIKKCYKKEDGPKSSKENLRKNNFKEAFRFKCHYCKKIGHKAENCWSKAKARNEISEKAEVTETVLQINGTKSESQWWCVDSGASSHMCSSKDQFQNIAQNDQVLNLANHSFTKIRGTGNVKIKVSNENNLRSVNLNNVMYVPDLRSNLLSVGKITDKGSTLIFENNKVYILDKDGKEIMIGQKRNHLYYVREILDKKGETAAASMNISRTKIQEWHEKFGHINEQQLKELARSNEVYGLNIGCNEHLINCSVCLKAKQTRKSFSRNESHKKETLLELIHTDICGPMRVNSIGGSRYFITFIDDKSGWCEIYFIKKKSEAASAFFKYKAMVENQLGKRIKCLRSDNGTEYLCSEFESYLEKHGIKHEMTVAYTPEQNGVAERRNRTLVEMARCMMIQSQLSPSFWAEAISTANYLRNRCPSRSINGQTPHKLWTGKDFSVKHFQIFGTKGYRLDKTPNKGKFDPRSKKCIFVGYSTERRAYRVWCPDSKRIYATRDVKFVNNFEVKEQPMQEEFTSEDIMKKEKEVEIYLNNYRKLENENESIENQPENEETEREASNNENQLEDQTEIDNLQENYNERREVETREKRKPGRPRFLYTGKKGRPKKLYVQACEEEITEKEGSRTNEITEEDPKTIKEAFLRQESEEWREAMKNEFNSLKKNKTWEIVDRPSDRKVIGCKWVLKTKLNSDGTIARRKARLVAKGYAQLPGIDFQETFAPVSRLCSVRLIMAIAAQYNLIVHQLDFVTAYLNGDIDEEIYMELPEGINEIGEEVVFKNKVCLLKKALYGLKQSGRQWYKKLDENLQKLNLRPLSTDKCIYMRKTRRGNEENMVLIAVYVDDIIIASNSMEEINNLKENLAKIFQMKDMGQIKYCLGIEFNVKKNKVTMSQKKYVDDLLKRFGMENSKEVSTPMDPNVKLSKEMCPKTEKEKEEMTRCPYQNLIGSLMYLSVSTRPDISYAVSCLSQYNTCFGKEHWIAAKRVLRYLKGTRDYGLVYEKNVEDIIGFADADWGANPDDRKSYTGYIFIFANCSVSWEARKQQTVALSSTEAEYMALSDATKEAIYLRRFLKEVLDIDKQIQIMNDNQGARSLAQNPIQHSRTKHIDIRHHFIREILQRKEIEIKYIQTGEMVADFLTKPLSKFKHNY
jgi:hypothetical protein